MHLNNVKTYFPLVSILIMLVGSLVSVNAQKTESPIEDDRIYQLKEVDKKPELLQKPSRVQTNGNCRELSRGTAIFEVILHRTGKVAKIKMLQSSQCEIFDRNAHSALTKVKFNPAIKDGKTVSVAQKFNFQFSYYY